MVVALFVVLTLVLAWPLPMHLADRVVGTDVDEGIFLWNLWWLQHAIIDLRSSPFFTEYIFYPVGVSLVYYTLTLTNGLLALPVVLMFGPAVATNLLLLGSLAVSGFGAYKLCDFLLRHAGVAAPTVGAILGGVVFAFAASRWVYASFGSSNLTTLWPLPLFLLALLRALDDARWGRRDWTQPTLAVIWIACGVYTELTLAMFQMFLAVVAVLWTITRANQSRPLP
ncbi:MAG: hypothetical protein NZ518_11575, partial [Dehalococcoidia bacterium]|nr:hypothetical protein [Dehalococcoidia bacterium]